MASLRFHRLAAKELRKAERWYARRSLRAVEGFTDQVALASDRICDHPGIGSPYDVIFREVKLGRFSYKFVYELITANEILILAVAHTRRRPGYWRRRRTNP